MVGDVLRLLETRRSAAYMREHGDPVEYTGRQVLKEVSHVQRGYGLADGWVILSFSAREVPDFTLIPMSMCAGREDQAQLTREMGDRSFFEDALLDSDNGAYSCFCRTCDKPFVGYKRKVTCRVCERKNPDE